MSDEKNCQAQIDNDQLVQHFITIYYNFTAKNITPDRICSMCLYSRERGGGSYFAQHSIENSVCHFYHRPVFCKWSTMMVTAAPAGEQAMMAVIIRYFIVTGDTLSAQMDTLPLRGSHQSLL